MNTLLVPSVELPEIQEKEMSDIRPYEKLRKELQDTCSLTISRSKGRAVIGGITLSPGNYCSAGCAYCYAKLRFSPDAAPTSFEVLRATFEFIRKSPIVRKGCGITLGGGGDPLENFDVYVRAIQLSKQYKEEYGLDIPVFLATIEPWFLKEEMIGTILENQKWIALSIDGDMNDGVYHRRRTDYLPLINKYSSSVTWAVSGVFTAKTVNRIRHNYGYFMDMGFQAIQLRPARLPSENPLSLTPKHFDIAVAQYDDLLETKLREKSIESFVSRLSSADSIGHFFFRYITGIDVDYRCGATNKVTSGALFVNSRGDIYPCPSTPYDNLYLGSVVSGNVHEHRLKSLGTIPTECQSCIISNVCGGPCLYESILSTGSTGAITPQNCRFLLDLAILVQKAICELFDTNPAALMTMISDYARRELGLNAQMV